ncbi:MAG: hypothetical protein JWO60_2613 [Frankiales bacterium]|nr:hypothetical protein [Frankiales bacterium]
MRPSVRPSQEAAVRRPVLLVLLLAAGAAVLRRRRAATLAEADLWHEATTAPDLR